MSGRRRQIGLSDQTASGAGRGGVVVVGEPGERRGQAVRRLGGREAERDSARADRFEADGCRGGRTSAYGGRVVACRSKWERAGCGEREGSELVRFFNSPGIIAGREVAAVRGGRRSRRPGTNNLSKRNGRQHANQVG